MEGIPAGRTVKIHALRAARNEIFRVCDDNALARKGICIGSRVEGKLQRGVWCALKHMRVGILDRTDKSVHFARSGTARALFGNAHPAHRDVFGGRKIVAEPAAPVPEIKAHIVADIVDHRRADRLAAEVQLIPVRIACGHGHILRGHRKGIRAVAVVGDIQRVCLPFGRGREKAREFFPRFLLGEDGDLRPLRAVALHRRGKGGIRNLHAEIHAARTADADVCERHAVFLARRAVDPLHAEILCAGIIRRLEGGVHRRRRIKGKFEQVIVHIDGAVQLLRIPFGRERLRIFDGRGRARFRESLRAAVISAVVAQRAVVVYQIFVDCSRRPHDAVKLPHLARLRLFGGARPAHRDVLGRGNAVHKPPG